MILDLLDLFYNTKTCLGGYVGLRVVDGRIGGERTRT